MDKEKLRVMGGLFIMVSVFLPLGFVTASLGERTWYIHSWIFGLTYEETVGGSQLLTFYVHWLSIVLSVVLLAVGALIMVSNNRENGKRVMILSFTLLAYRVFVMIVAVLSSQPVDDEYTYIYYPHIGFYIAVVGCILAIISNTELIEKIFKK